MKLKAANKKNKLVPFEVIAEELGTTKQNVQQTYDRAMKKIEKYFKLGYDANGDITFVPRDEKKVEKLIRRRKKLEESRDKTGRRLGTKYLSKYKKGGKWVYIYRKKDVIRRK